MFWKKKPATEEPPKPKVEKLPGPKEIPGLVGKHLTAEYKMDPDLVRILKAAIRASSTGEGVFDIRVFDESEATANEVQIKDYTSLDEHPDLIIYRGWFDKKSGEVQIIVAEVQIEEQKAA